MTVLLTGLAVASTLCASIARAQSTDVVTELRGDKAPWMEGVPASAQRAARLLFLSGNELIDQSLFGKASTKYKQALELWAHPAFHYNLAIAQINLDQPIAAYENFRRALRYGHAPLTRAKYKEGKNYLVLLERQLAHVELICNKAGAQVSLDGAFALQCPGTHRAVLRPGSHQVVATKPNGMSHSEDITLAPGERRQHEVAVDRLVPWRRWAVWKPFAVLASGTAIMLGAGYVNWRTSTDLATVRRELIELCSDRCATLPPRFSASRIERQERMQRASFVLASAGGAVVVTSVVLIYLNQKRLVVRDKDEPSRVTVSPSLGPGSGQIHVRWQF